jgi:hypothetical protein
VIVSGIAAVTWPGLVRPPGRAAGRLEQAEPFGLAVPVFGQVQDEASAAAAGDAGGHVDQVGTDWASVNGEPVNTGW